MPDENVRPKITPAIQKALDAWDSLPTNERNYKKVASIINVTEGRAADYVRKGLIASDRADETPRGANGSGTGTRTPAVSDFEQQLKDLADQNRATADDLNTQIQDAQKAAADFEAEAYMTSEREKREQAVADAQKALTAWTEDTDGVATKAAEAEQKRLTERAEKLVEANGKQIETATAAADQAAEMLARMVEQREAAETTTTTE